MGSFPILDNDELRSFLRAEIQAALDVIRTQPTLASQMSGPPHPSMLPVQSSSAQPAGAILPLGAMPAPTALISVTTITPRTSAVHSEVAPPFSAPLLASASPSSIGSRLQSQTGIPITTMAISTTAQVLPGPKGVILSPAFQPIPARLVQRINSAKFVEMRDLLSDNIALHDQLESVHGPLQTISTPGFFASSDARGSFSYLLGVLFCSLCGHTNL